MQFSRVRVSCFRDDFMRRIGFGLRIIRLDWHFAQRRLYPLYRGYHCNIPLLFDDWKDKPKIRWFEQDHPGSLERRPFDPEEDEFGLKKRIEELEKELEELKKVGLAENSPLLEMLSEEDKKKARELILKHRREDDSFPLDEHGNVKPGHYQEAPEKKSRQQSKHSVEDAKMFDDLLRVPLDQQVHLRSLIVWLRRATLDPASEMNRRELWRWYSRCKYNLPALVAKMPPEAWDVLWNSQSRASGQNCDRAQHLKILAQDMEAADYALNGAQELLYIEVLFQTGSVEDAFERWKAASGRLRRDAATAKEYWALGVKMVAAQEDPQVAQDVALPILEHFTDADYRILMPVISAWLNSSHEAKIYHAYVLYLQLKKGLGKTINMDDYDTLCVAFLHAGRTDVALSIFRDMMLTEQKGFDMEAFSSKALEITGTLQQMSANETDVNKISLTALTVLPRRLENKYFYGKWLKKLIGMNEIDSAAAVVELMFERGVRPDARHLNGLVAGWLRCGDASSKKKAESMVWSMIGERLDFVRQRRGEENPSQTNTADTNVPSFLQRRAPPATIETFSIMLKYYTRRSMDQYVDELVRLLYKAEIPPNSFFMNHLVYMDLRKHNIDRAFYLYRQMTKVVRPDLETFACLWDCEKARMAKGTKSSYFPTPRRLFKEMIDWFLNLGERERHQRVEEFTAELYNQIIRCFCLQRDVDGALVALHALKKLFSLYPNDSTARMLALQITRITSAGPNMPQPRGLRKRLSQIPNTRTNFSKVTKILNAMTQKQLGVLAAQGAADNEEDAEHKRQELQLHVLSQFLNSFRHRLISGTDVPAIEDVAKEMGVQDAIPHI